MKAPLLHDASENAVSLLPAPLFEKQESETRSGGREGRGGVQGGAVCGLSLRAASGVEVEVCERDGGVGEGGGVLRGEGGGWGGRGWGGREGVGSEGGGERVRRERRAGEGVSEVGSG